MNKKGQEYTAITTMEYAFLVILAIFFSVAVYNGLDDQKINQLKADDLAITIDSAFLLEDDANIFYGLGNEFNIDGELNRIRIYGSDIDNWGIKDLTVDGEYDFAEDISGKKDSVLIKKEGKRVVIA